MPTRSALTRILILPLLAAGAFAARADEGRIPVFGPTTLSQPGSYILTRDITCATSCISITSSNVTLDLNHFTITGSSGTCGSDLIRIETTTAQEGIVVRNGLLRDGCSGVTATSANPVTLTVEGLDIRGMQYNGVEINNGGTVSVRDTVIAQTGGYGITAVGPVAGPFAGTFLRNSIRNVLFSGIFVRTLQGGTIAGNHIVDFGLGGQDQFGICLKGLPGVASGGNLVEENYIASVSTGSPNGGSVGIYVENNSPRNTLRRNILEHCGQGIGSFADETRIVENLVNRNSGISGISVGWNASSGQLNVIEGNQVQGNGCGIYFNNGLTHVYRNNVLKGNTSGSLCGSANIDGGGNVL